LCREIYEDEFICSFDSIAQRENERREFIRHAVTSGECFVATGSEIMRGICLMGRRNIVENLAILMTQTNFDAIIFLL
jgi:hypothetical protein